MKVTSISVSLANTGKLCGYARIVLDDCLVVDGLKIIECDTALFISMPSRKWQNGTFADIVHPINSKTREMIERSVLVEYRRVDKNPSLSIPRSI
jgi:stage V sporulation protein G